MDEKVLSTIIIKNINWKISNIYSTYSFVSLFQKIFSTTLKQASYKWSKLCN